jgi:hypothetical protein
MLASVAAVSLWKLTTGSFSLDRDLLLVDCDGTWENSDAGLPSVFFFFLLRSPSQSQFSEPLVSVGSES